MGASIKVTLRLPRDVRGRLSVSSRNMHRVSTQRRHFVSSVCHLNFICSDRPCLIVLFREHAGLHRLGFSLFVQSKLNEACDVLKQALSIWRNSCSGAENNLSINQSLPTAACVVKMAVYNACESVPLVSR